MFFSVLIPVYKTIEYLEECIESILCQSFEDYEIVLLDDGSPDGCSEVCDRFALEFPSIIVVHKFNEGLLLSRRKGFIFARGQFFICVDSDDYLVSKNAFAEIYYTLKKTGSDLLLFDYLYGAEEEQNTRKISIIAGCETVFTDKTQYYRRVLNSKWANAIWAKVMSRDIVDIDSSYEQINSSLYKSMGEDLIQSLPIYTNATIIAHLKRYLYYYRYNENSISKNPDIGFYYALKTQYNTMNYYMDLWKMDIDTKEDIKHRFQRKIICHIIASLSKTKEGSRLWHQFVETIYEDALIADLSQRKSDSMIDHYYCFIAKMIVKKKGYIASGVIRLVTAINNITTRLQTSKRSV